MMAGDLKDRNAQLFVSLVIGLVQAAWMQLGKVKNELTGGIDRNLEAAKITIDTIAALELKTRGNLSAEEADVLKRALTELRMNYVDELKKAQAPAVEAPAPAAAAVPEAPSSEAPSIEAAAVAEAEAAPVTGPEPESTGS